MKTAFHKPTGKAVTLIEAVNVGLGWICRDSDGKVFGAKLEDLFDELGERLYPNAEIERRRKIISGAGE